MDYFEKLEQNPYEDLTWNIPERRQGVVNVIGGNEQRFRDEVKVAEFLASQYPLQEVKVVVPDALRAKLPELPNFVFLPATESGSFGESQELMDIFNTASYNLVLGDLSRNAVTGRAVASACVSAEKGMFLTRDAVDLLVENSPERVLMNENLTLMASVAQLTKLLRAVYYPKMLIMSASLVQVAEVLHKFTLSYPVKIVTLQDGQILVAENGVVKAVALEKSGYAPFTFWSGEMAAKIVAMNLYNLNQFIPATVCGIFK
ncbi:hypothetical protein IKE82_02670 [Candidatus Saccharibacteria bacterium]|nr:hypothetical protein [Candidatus Saccharibacteria bacterium]